MNDTEDETAAHATTASDVWTHKNQVYFYSEVTRESVLHLIRALLKLRDEDNVKRIYLFIHSDGGDLHAGLGAMDHIQNLGVEVRTVMDGFVASAATLIFLAGTRRYVMPNANLLIHQLSTEFWGKFQDLQDEMANSKSLMDTIKSIYTKHTNIPRKDIKSLLKREMYLSAERCMELGIAEKPYKRKARSQCSL